MLRLLSHRVPLFLTVPFVFVSVFFLYTYQTQFLRAGLQSCGSGETQPVQPASGVDIATKPTDPRCNAFPDQGNLQVIIKTGATEAYEKLLPQLMTTLSCSKRIDIFSDLEETIGGYHVRDALEDFDSEMKLNDPDFEIYRTQQEYHATGQDITELGKKHKAVWTLDKYKFMHMVQKTWDLNPNLDWYLFIESDTYVFWSNLNIWLQRLDPKEKLYLGSEALIGGDQYFAHGGSGFVLSGALLKRFAGDDSQMASRNDKILPNMCCGDLVLARAIRKYVGVEVQNNWPWINGETPWTIPFGPNYWCKPIITMHHIAPRQRALIYAFEQKRKNQHVSKEPFPGCTSVMLNNTGAGTNTVPRVIRTILPHRQYEDARSRLGQPFGSSRR